MKTKTVRSVAAVAVIALSLACAGSASAWVGTAGSGEPPTTKGTTNTWWFNYTPEPLGYQVCFTVYKNGTEIAGYPKNYPTGGHPTGTNMCTGEIRGTSQNANIPFTWNGLEHGARYQVCAV